MRAISINPVLNGFIVTVGCQSLAYTSIDKLLLDLGKYLRDPEATEKEIVEKEGINARHTLDQPVSPPTEPYPEGTMATMAPMANGRVDRGIEFDPNPGRAYRR